MLRVELPPTGTDPRACVYGARFLTIIPLCLLMVACSGERTRETSADSRGKRDGSVGSSMLAVRDSAGIDQAVKAVSAVSESLEVAVSRGNPSAVVRFYEPGASEYSGVGGLPVLHDTAAIRASYADMFRDLDADGREFDTRIDVRDDIAVESGQYFQDWASRRESPAPASRTVGDVLTVWRRNGSGAWRVSWRVFIPRSAGPVDPRER